MASRAASRYAKAVLAQASEEKNEELIYGNMKSIAQTLSSSKELRDVLNSPVIKADKKRDILREIFSDSQQVVKNLFDVLIDRNRTGILDDISEAYISVYNKAHGVVVAKVTTAVPLDAKLEAEILAKVKELTGSQKVNLEHKIDEDIIGGFILRIGDTQYDASAANQLDRIREEFSTRIV
ncbi:MAG: ATP synthase F1 subunit delta [Leeuwenhoekiella sp.]